MPFNTKHLLNGRAGNICIQDADFISFFGQFYCKAAGHKGFSNTAFSADHTDYLFNIAETILLF